VFSQRVASATLFFDWITGWAMRQVQ